MSVYTELLRVGVQDDIAREIDAAVHRSQSVVTADILDARLAQVEIRMIRMETQIIKWNVGALAVLTTIFAAIVKLG